MFDKVRQLPWRYCGFFANQRDIKTSCLYLKQLWTLSNIAHRSGPRWWCDDNLGRNHNGRTICMSLMRSQVSSAQWDAYCQQQPGPSVFTLCLVSRSDNYTLQLHLQPSPGHLVTVTRPHSSAHCAFSGSGTLLRSSDRLICPLCPKGFGDKVYTYLGNVLLLWGRGLL